MAQTHDDQRPRRARVERGVYQQPNRKYAVCFMLDGKPRFRTVEGAIDDARAERARLAVAAKAGLLPVGPRLTFAHVAARWLERFETMVAVGERRVRTLDSHRYHLERHLLPTLGRRRVAALTVDDIANLIRGLVAQGRAPRTIAARSRRSGRSCATRCGAVTSPTTRCRAWRRANVRGRSRTPGERWVRKKSRGCWRRARRATGC
jgi:hypothetical protein